MQCIKVNSALHNIVFLTVLAGVWIIESQVQRAQLNTDGWIMDKKRSKKPSGAQFRKRRKEEEEKQAKMKVCS